MFRLTFLLAALAILSVPAQAQHHGGMSPEVEGVTEMFVVDGLRVKQDSVPPGSAVGRAGLRFDDGGYVSVVYGKPYARGRTIFGGLVGYDQVWSTGAHRATEISTTVPLFIGGTTLQPGIYTLFTTPREDRWTFHVNRIVGMHLADEYDRANDITRVEAVPEILEEPVDGLKMEFVTGVHMTGLGLQISWDNVAVTLPLKRAE
ncbi:MAG: hypothetical protein Rubg2KO_35600 [Rubricoccaceae bacterium]